MVIMCQIENDDSFTKQDFQDMSKFTKYYACHQKKSHVYHAGQRFNIVQKAWKSVRRPAHVTENDVPDFKMPREPYASHEKWT